MGTHIHVELHLNQQSCSEVASIVEQFLSDIDAFKDAVLLQSRMSGNPGETVIPSRRDSLRSSQRRARESARSRRRLRRVRNSFAKAATTLAPLWSDSDGLDLDQNVRPAPIGAGHSGARRRAGAKAIGVDGVHARHVARVAQKYSGLDDIVE